MGQARPADPQTRTRRAEGECDKADQEESPFLLTEILRGRLPQAGGGSAPFARPEKTLSQKTLRVDINGQPDAFGLAGLPQPGRNGILQSGVFRRTDQQANTVAAAYPGNRGGGGTQHLAADLADRAIGPGEIGSEIEQRLQIGPGKDDAGKTAERGGRWPADAHSPAPVSRRDLLAVYPDTGVIPSV